MNHDGHTEVGRCSKENVASLINIYKRRKNRCHGRDAYNFNSTGSISIALFITSPINPPSS